MRKLIVLPSFIDKSFIDDFVTNDNLHVILSEQDLIKYHSTCYKLLLWMIGDNIKSFINCKNKTTILDIYNMLYAYSMPTDRVIEYQILNDVSNAQMNWSETNMITIIDDYRKISTVTNNIVNPNAIYIMVDKVDAAGDSFNVTKQSDQCINKLISISPGALQVLDKKDSAKYFNHDVINKLYINTLY